MSAVDDHAPKVRASTTNKKMTNDHPEHYICVNEQRGKRKHSFAN